MTTLATLIEMLSTIVEMEGIEIEVIDEGTIVLGEGSAIDSLATALFLVEVGEAYNHANLMNQLQGLSLAFITLADIAKFIEQKM